MGFQIQIWAILRVFLVDFGNVLCSSANELQQNSNASSREDYLKLFKDRLLNKQTVVLFAP